ncbi:MAG: hypothetical protein JRF33_07655 [Deltaproteobacteria bacterium]|nr:hypothetical protein [Deltaproteobacteria bacterium]
MSIQALLVILLGSSLVGKVNLPCCSYVGFWEDPKLVEISEEGKGYQPAKVLRVSFCRDLNGHWNPVDLAWTGERNELENKKVSEIENTEFWMVNSQETETSSIALRRKSSWDSSVEENIFFVSSKDRRPISKTGTQNLYADCGWVTHPKIYASHLGSKLETKLSRSRCKISPCPARRLLPEFPNVRKANTVGLVRKNDYELTRCWTTKSGAQLAVFKLPRITKALTKSGEEHMFVGEHWVVLGTKKNLYLGNEVKFLGELTLNEDANPVLLFWRSVHQDEAGYLLADPKNASLIKKVWHGH